jgi:hypothetical protein
MTVHVGELTSAVQVHGAPAAAGTGAPGAEQPTWHERARLADMVDERCRERQRIAAERFDG